MVGLNSYLLCLRQLKFKFNFFINFIRDWAFVNREMINSVMGLGFFYLHIAPNPHTLK